MNDGMRAPLMRCCQLRSLVGSGCFVLALSACGGSSDNTPAIVSRPKRDAVAALAAPVPILPIALDTSAALVLDVWPLSIAPARQMEETRRIVEHLHADLALMAGFESAALLASGDGAGLLLVAAWRDARSADRASPALAGWLRAESDSAVRRRRLGSATMRVRVRRTFGTPPLLSDAAMLQVTRYALKPGHSFGALAALADSNLAMRVLQDPAALGGATLAASDSGALYVLLQARTATALDARVQTGGTLPFWAPFASRDEQLVAVVASVRHR